MKKILIIAGILFVLLVIAAVVVALHLDAIVKSGVESVAPGITQTTVKLESVSVSPLSGAASLKGLVIGNPAGYSAPEAVRIGRAAVHLEPTSLLHDKVIIRSVELHEPEITFEGNPLGANNLQKLLDNVTAKAAADAGKPSTATKSEGKKLQVDDVLIAGAKLHAQIHTPILTREVSLTLPDIRLSQLGQGPDGITSAELTRQVLNQITLATVKALGEAVAGLGQDILNGAGQNAGDAVKKAAGRLGDLFKNK